MDYIEINQEIYRVGKRLDAAPRSIFESAKEFAEAERVYRMELSKEIIKLKAEGIQASLIPDVARGNVSDLKFNRDLAEGKYKASLESSKALQAELSGLQSILKIQGDITNERKRA